MRALVGDLLLPIAREMIGERLFAIGRASVAPHDVDSELRAAGVPMADGVGE